MKRWRKAPPLSYGGLSLKPKAAEPDAVVEEAPAPVEEGQEPRRPRPMETKADLALVYMSPEAKLALKHFALARSAKVKAHDLLIEALEECGERKGLNVGGRPVERRARSARPRRS